MAYSERCKPVLLLYFVVSHSQSCNKTGLPIVCIYCIIVTRDKRKKGKWSEHSHIVQRNNNFYYDVPRQMIHNVSAFITRSVFWCEHLTWTVFRCGIYSPRNLIFLCSYDIGSESSRRQHHYAFYPRNCSSISAYDIKLTPCSVKIKLIDFSKYLKGSAIDVN